jgi:hypothetical protein
VHQGLFSGGGVQYFHECAYLMRVRTNAPE